MSSAERDPVYCPDSNAASDEFGRLLAWIRQRLPADGERTCVLGVVGLPGSGKSTLAERIVAAVALPRSLAVSLDDFYRTPAERQALGLSFRGPPGTHEPGLLERFLEQLLSRAAQLDVPVYDRERERRLPERHVQGPLSLCIIEGWFMGARCPGYERLADALDLLIYLDMDVDAARAARFAREAWLRKQGRGGMTEAEVSCFWEQALSPYFARWVYPLRERADAVLTIDAAHRATALKLYPPRR
jgi:pantothenate kinase-related protein Tda10